MKKKGLKGTFSLFFPETNLQLHCRRRCAKRSDWNRSYIFFTVGREGATEPERSWQLLSAGLEQLSHRSPDCIVGGGAGDHINTDCGLSAPLRRWWQTCDVWTAICQHRRDEAEREWDRPFWRERKKSSKLANDVKFALKKNHFVGTQQKEMVGFLILQDLQTMQFWKWEHLQPPEASG